MQLQLPIILIFISVALALPIPDEEVSLLKSPSVGEIEDDLGSFTKKLNIETTISSISPDVKAISSENKSDKPILPVETPDSELLSLSPEHKQENKKDDIEIKLPSTTTKPVEEKKQIINGKTTTVIYTTANNQLKTEAVTTNVPEKQNVTPNISTSMKPELSQNKIQEKLLDSKLIITTVATLVAENSKIANTFPKAFSNNSESKQKQTTSITIGDISKELSE